ncbi:MAG: beta-ketoacyl-ACP synthase II [Kiritimatiellae bacterium]|nr:beta-ketoacyl-ACP synthase II [Kiritimatiellia bacterium]
MQKRVVITGMGVVSPLGCDLETLWSRLLSATSGVVPLDRFDAAEYSTRIAAQVRDFDLNSFIPPKEQRRMDRYCWYALAAARMAVRDAGIDLSRYAPARSGAAISSGVGGLETLSEQARVIAEKGPRRVSPFTVPAMIVNMGAGLVAIEHNLQGPNYAVVTACASALHSIGLAARSIRDGECDVMVAGGAEACITPLGVASFASMRALSSRNDDPAHASRPFDKERDGFIMGEGAGIVVLEALDQAVARGARIYGEVAGFGMTADAFHMTAPRDDGDGAKRAMQQAMAEARLNPSDVDYINAHGTSTPLNDKIETLAIKGALGPEHAKRVMISSSKSMTGHMLGAAGGIETIVCALAMHRGVVPPTANYTTPDPDCDLDYVPNTAREATVRACLNNSLGFGGHNGCLALKRVP